jgi:excisionase family DNA binding protein
MSDPGHLLPAEKPLYSVEEAAVALQLHPATLWKLARAGKLRMVKIGKRTTIRRDDLEALIMASSHQGR